MPLVEDVRLYPSSFTFASSDAASSRRMQISTLKGIFHSIFSSGLCSQNLKISWCGDHEFESHMDFYQGALDAVLGLAPKAVTIHNEFNIGAAGVREKWYPFLKATDSSVRICADKPGDLAPNSVIRSCLALFRRHGVRAGVLYLFSNPSSDGADAFFDFCATQSADFVDLEARPSALARDFDNFLRTLWNLSRASRVSNVCLLSEVLERLLKPSNQLVENSLVRPFSTLTIDAEGHCATFCSPFLAPETREFRCLNIGNIAAKPLSQIVVQSSTVALIESVNRGVEACRAECGYFDICGGGVPSEKIRENKTVVSTETSHCRLMIKTAANVAMDVIEASATETLVAKRIH
jgi:uncharacterized protein